MRHAEQLSPAQGARADDLSDEEVIARVISGHRDDFSVIIRRYNQRLFRTVRSVVRNDAEAEEIVQQTYLDAYSHLETFRGEALFSTWLTRIALYRSWDRSRQIRRHTAFVSIEVDEVSHAHHRPPSPETRASQQQLKRYVETALDNLPETLRAPLMLREVEGLSSREVAEILDISESALRVRVHRGRAMLRSEIESRTSLALDEAFSFAGDRCDRITASVMGEITVLTHQQ